MLFFVLFFFFFFFKQKTAYEMLRSLVGSEMCIRDSGKIADPSTQSAFAGIRFLANDATGIVELELHRGHAIFLKVEGVVNADADQDLHGDEVFTQGNGDFSDMEW
eukprot:TRINITY_DN17403_c0_g2_i1.p2 TRINITY_DN17403_c0_g2~~TRINITY_DN17403_c0_g2_i1.p2  ORF type:complete len:106 (-),score=56.98 TRINITY_DN17403_c0_g2_i1:133-450(-)